MSGFGHQAVRPRVTAVWRFSPFLYGKRRTSVRRQRPLHCSARPQGARHPDSQLPQGWGALVLPLSPPCSLRTRCPLPNLHVELPVCTFPSSAFTRACLRSEGAPRTFIPGRAVSCHSEASPQVPVSVRPPSPTGRFSGGFGQFVAAGFIHLRAARG